MQPIYRFEGVKKSYSGRLVLDLDYLEVLPGEILVMVGPSGAGKSTQLRLHNFLEYADAGRGFYHDRAISPVMPIELRRQVAMVFQRPALLTRSVEENVAYGLKLRGLGASREKITRALDRMGLGALRHAPARTLSGGEMQRVALARVMVLQPRVLLLDEPTANLDPYNIGLIEEVVREINQTLDTTVIMVTHNVFQARRLAHRVGLLLNGRLVELCDGHTFFESPTDARTRAFVKGEMIY